MSTSMYYNINDLSETDFDPGKSHLPDAIKAEFGRRLFSFMLEKGWSASELARQTKIGRDSISIYLRGKSFPNPQRLIKISEALGISVDDLAPGVPNKTKRNRMSDDIADMSSIDKDNVMLTIRKKLDKKTAVRVLAILSGVIQ